MTFIAATAHAQDSPIFTTNPDAGVDLSGNDGFWNRETLGDAVDQALPIPENGFDSVALGDAHHDIDEDIENGRYATEDAQIEADLGNHIVEPRDFNETEPFVQEALGSSGAYFSSSRLVPEDARLHYPYRVNGKIFFTKPGVGNFICSGTVIKPRLVLTAGHCVHKGSNGGGGFYTNIIFVPAYHRGNAPYQEWTYTWVATTAAWSTSNGNVPNAGDFAIIEVADREFDGEKKRIGDVVGWAGYRTGALSPNHTKKIGYPGNHDRGEVMHQVDSTWHEDASQNTVLYGSDMRGGSSGGGWFENFGVKAEGQTGAQNDSPNRLVGVTSYGFTDNDPKVQGSSRLGQEFVDLINLGCNNQMGNC
ncbi:trypsin-like serine peptidase [Roseibium sp.]|uniref:trypsin-like serine peptidase n=1 Tax=Roseibium sp. TaxID=1936156 RepID=UPI003A985912